jgi:hypothetical protein
MVTPDLLPDSLEILSSWIALIDSNGWVAREQILGEEARSKVTYCHAIIYRWLMRCLGSCGVPDASASVCESPNLGHGGYRLHPPFAKDGVVRPE